MSSLAYCSCTYDTYQTSPLYIPLLVTRSLPCRMAIRLIAYMKQVAVHAANTFELSLLLVSFTAVALDTAELKYHVAMETQIFERAYLQITVSGWFKQASIHTHTYNAVTIVWDWLRLAQITTLTQTSF